MNQDGRGDFLRRSLSTLSALFIPSLSATLNPPLARRYLWSGEVSETKLSQAATRSASANLAGARVAPLQPTPHPSVSFLPLFSLQVF